MLHYKNNTLYMDEISLTDLATTYGTPLYAYSQHDLEQNYLAYQQAFKRLNPLICYAVKANSNLSILQKFNQLGSGFDIVSGGELSRVLQAGGQAEKIIFSGIGKSIEEINLAIKLGIFCINVESIPEIERIHKIAQNLGKKVPISLRINPDVNPKTHPYISTGLKSNKFGIAYQDAISVYQYASKLEFLDIKGIDCHIGSQLLDLSPMIEACERILLLVDQLQDLGIHLSHIDLGGGIGIPYHENEAKADLQQYAAAIEKLIGSRPLQLILEPGRSLIGNAGVLLTRVEFIKQGEETNFIIVDAAMNDLMRPSLYQAYHHIQEVVNKNIQPIHGHIVGPICETGDFLGHDRQLKVTQTDLLAIHNAGAYAFSMASNYNSRLRPAEVLVNGSQHRLIRRKERIESLLNDEIDFLSDKDLSIS